MAEEPQLPLNRCANCGQPHRSHRARMAAAPTCPTGGIYREATEEELDKMYAEAFPEGMPEPIATFRRDNPEDMARFRQAFSPDALRVHFGPKGGGIDAISEILKGQQANG